MCFNLSLKIIWHISWDNYLSNDIDEDANGDRDIGPGGQNQAPTQIRAADTEQRAAASTVRRVSQQTCPSHERLSSTWYKLSITSDIVVPKQAPVPDTLCLGEAFVGRLWSNWPVQPYQASQALLFLE